MDSYTLMERAALYHAAFPKFPPLRADERWIDGMWCMGNNYKGSGYYGSFPPSFLKRIVSLFPDAKNILHVFSGSLPKGNYTRFDINPMLEPEVVGNAEELSKHIPFSPDLIICDPPYSKEHAKKYGYPMPNRKKVLAEAARILHPGGYIVWLDTMLPMFSKKALHLCGLIGIVRSTNHMVRLASIFKFAPLPQGDKQGTSKLCHQEIDHDSPMTYDETS